MKIVILGCGTSTGVPVIGCKCGICLSSEAGNKRTRSSVFVHANDRNILIDTSTDLRQQALAHNINRVDAVLYTHPHADHIHGIDELRAFNMIQEGAIPCYGSKETIKRVKNMFDYIFSEDIYGGWKPNIEISEIKSPFKLFGIDVIPVDIRHGKSTIFGFRLNNFAYITDCSGIPEPSLEHLKGLDLLIIGALRHKPHPSHFTIKEAVDASKKINPKRTILTHLSHNVDYIKDSTGLPSGIELAYDGLEIQLGD